MLQTIGLELLGTLIARYLDKGAVWLADQGWFMPRAVHIRDLRQKLAGMPFIYRDLQLDVISDFVETNLRSLNRTTLMPLTERESDYRGTFERLREPRRLMLVGQAGMGKTTLFRYSIQSLINKGVRGIRLRPKEVVVPFLVPLKAIDNTGPSPILRYLLANNEYLAGSKGAARLQQLAQRNELMVFLDGYDEIPHAGGTRYITDELAALTSSSVKDIPRAFEDSGYLPIYRDIRNCRLWISTRKEFYLQFPFLLNREVSIFEATGMTTQRIQLVEKIFERYRRAGGEYFIERLNAERFMQQLAKVGDDTLQSLSANPLFLTVMCYVYVGQIREKQDPDDIWRRGANELVHRCLQLLIEDIDEYKARGLSTTEQTALMNRRAIYAPEKLEFLRYLSVRAYLDRAPLFERKYLDGVARNFFSQKPEKDDNEVILRGLTRSEPAANLVSQLILSGVFIYVERNSNQELLDFPHRRFREILACDYFDTDAGCQQICERVRDADFYELILVYVERSPRGDVVTRAVLREVERWEDSFEPGRLLAACLQRIRPRSAFAGVVTQVIRSLASEESPHPLPSALLEHLSTDQETRRYLESLLDRSIKTEDPRLLALAAPADYRLNPALLVDSLRTALANSGRSRFTWELLGNLMDLNPDPALLAEVGAIIWPEETLKRELWRDLSNFAFVSIFGRSPEIKEASVKFIGKKFGAEGLSFLKEWASNYDRSLAREAMLEAVRPVQLAQFQHVRPLRIGIWLQDASTSQTAPRESFENFDTRFPLAGARLSLSFVVEEESPRFSQLVSYLREHAPQLHGLRQGNSLTLPGLEATIQNINGVPSKMSFTIREDAPQDEPIPFDPDLPTGVNLYLLEEVGGRWLRQDYDLTRAARKLKFGGGRRVFSCGWHTERFTFSLEDMTVQSLLNAGVDSPAVLGNDVTWSVRDLSSKILAWHIDGGKSESLGLGGITIRFGKKTHVGMGTAAIDVVQNTQAGTSLGVVEFPRSPWQLRQLLSASHTSELTLSGFHFLTLD